MDSHPNYKGYDTTKGKVRSLARQRRIERIKLGKKADALLAAGKPKEPKPKIQLLPHVGALTIKDLKHGVPGNWLSVLNDIREWCDQAGLAYCPSPFDYQLAKITGDGVCIVLWRSSRKGRVFMKAAFEGAQGVASDDAMQRVKSMIDGSVAA